MNNEWQLLYYKQATYEDQMQINADILGGDLLLGSLSSGLDCVYRLLPDSPFIWVFWAVVIDDRGCTLINAAHNVVHNETLFMHEWRIPYETYVVFDILFSGNSITF